MHINYIYSPPSNKFEGVGKGYLIASLLKMGWFNHVLSFVSTVEGNLSMNVDRHFRISVRTIFPLDIAVLKEQFPHDRISCLSSFFSIPSSWSRRSAQWSSYFSMEYRRIHETFRLVKKSLILMHPKPPWFLGAKSTSSGIHFFLLLAMYKHNVFCH